MLKMLISTVDFLHRSNETIIGVLRFAFAVNFLLRALLLIVSIGPSGNLLYAEIR